MKTPVAITQPSEDVERRTRRKPWGLEIEVWQRTNTITVPESAAGAMALSSLLAPLPIEAPAPPSPFDDDTLDVPADPTPAWHSILPDDEPLDPALIKSPGSE